MAGREFQSDYPQIADLFEGSVYEVNAAIVVSRFFRIYKAIMAFGAKGKDRSCEVRRRRWRIGLFQEVVSSYIAFRGLD